MRFIKTFIFIAVLTALLLWLGNFLGGKTGLIIALIISFLINFLSYYYSDKIINLFPHEELKEDNYIYQLVKSIALKANVKMPRVFLIKDNALNAFATGRKNNPLVALTKGLVDNLSTDELRAVIAHEITHIKNNDLFIQVIASTIAGVISFIGSMLRWGLFFGRDNDDNFLSLLIILILTPVITLLLQLAISRTREYDADEGAARLTNPQLMIRALKKISFLNKTRPMKVNQALEPLFIVSPFFELLSTHPSIEKRIKTLEKLK